MFTIRSPERRNLNGKDDRESSYFLRGYYLVIILINLLGPFISDSIQPAIDKVSDIVHNAWTGLQHTIGADFGSHSDNHWSWHH